LEPSEYQAIFNFEADQATARAARTAVSELIYDELKKSLKLGRSVLASGCSLCC
jgi:hypothetical protein